MELIGVSHGSTLVRDFTIYYLEQKYPELDSLMLELAPCYQESQGSDDFFAPIAQHFASRKTKIIPADTKRFAMLKMTEEEYINNTKTLCGLLTNARKELFAPVRALLKHNLRLRDEAMNEVFVQEQPTASVLGAAHAAYLKIQHPSIPYTSISSEKRDCDDILRKALGLPQPFALSEQHVHIDLHSAESLQSLLKRNAVALAGVSSVALGSYVEQVHDNSLLAVSLIFAGAYVGFQNMDSFVGLKKKLRKK